MTTAHSTDPVRSTPFVTLRAGCDAHVCPECNAHLTVPHGVEKEFVACPDCGQCLSAPPHWICARTEWGLVRPQWPFGHYQGSGWAGIIVGSVIGAVAIFPWIHEWGRAGAICLGMALAIEGVGRLLVQSRKKADSRPARHVAVAEPRRDLGAVKAVFVSKNSLLDSLALCFLALAIACGLGWIVSWMIGGLMHVKLILCVIAIPIMVGYVAYRCVRLVAERRCLVICASGMHVAKSNTLTSFVWTDVRKLTAVHIGDMIDEDAIDVELGGGRPEWRFTRAQFSNIESLWERIVQVAADSIDPSCIGSRWVDQSSQH